jgi:hypothetical protein
MIMDEIAKAPGVIGRGINVTVDVDPSSTL